MGRRCRRGTAVTQHMYLLAAYKRGYAAGLDWKQGQPIRCPYFCASKWMAWHAGFDRALFQAPAARWPD